MVMMAEPLEKALKAARQRQKSAGVTRSRVVHLSPQGRTLDHRKVMELAALQGLVLVAGRYEGVDERLIARVVDEEISIGDYVLSGGELAAMVVMDAVVRQMPGALGDAESASQDSFVNGLLDCPHYTRPEVYEGEAVPQVLMSGNHAVIARWPEFSAGDTVVVSVNVVEGDRKRLQAYEGVVIAKRNRGLNSSFIVRKISSGEGVERTFQTYSPLIASIEVRRRGDVRRSKLYHLRERTGKAARIREKLDVVTEEGTAGESKG